MKRSFAFRKAAIAAIALTLGVMSQPQESIAQTINIGPNQYAFRYTTNPNYGLYFNATNVRYEFRNGAAAPIFAFNADNGLMNTNIEFAAGSDLRVGPNRYAFRSSVAPNIGLFATNTRIQFLNAAATPIFSIDINDGRFDTDLEFLPGRNFRVAAGNYAIRSATAPNAGIYFGNVDYEFRNAAGAPIFRVNSANGNTIASGTIAATGGNSTQWNSAFGWGNHATAGYINSESDPKIGALGVGDVPRWSGSQLTPSILSTTTADVQINSGASTPVLSFNSTLASGNPLLSFRKAGVQTAWIQSFGTDFYLANQQNGSLFLRTNNQTRMSINGDGQIGVNATPSATSSFYAVKSVAGFDGAAVEGMVTYSGTSDVTAVRGYSVTAPGYGYGVRGTGGYRGVYGFGEGGDYTGTVYGVQGATSGTGVGTRVGVYGSASGGATNWASYFVGNSYVSGDMRVGTINGATGYKLSVNGRIICTEARVQAVANWPDYVFDESYELMSLEDLEKFLAVEKHLPGIPSANEILEAEGFDLGEMHKMTLEKVEELTLYIIAQNKRLEAQDALRANQEAAMAKQQEEIDALKAMIHNLVKN